MTNLLPALLLTAAPEGPLELRGELRAGFVHEAGEAASTDRFELTTARARAALRPAEHARLELGVEALRSAGPGSLVGIDGNSLVLRVDRAFGRAGLPLGPGVLDGALGLLPEPWLAAIDAGRAERGLASPLGESAGLFGTADLGGEVRWRGLHERLALTLQATNGEGRRDVERNDGKNLSATLEGAPASFAAFRGVATVRLAVTARDGSLGPGSARDQRLALAASVSEPGLGLGGAWARAAGFQGDGARDADGFALWAAGEPLQRRVGLYARFERLRTSIGVDDAEWTSVRAGLYANLVAPEGEAQAPLQLWLGAELLRPGPRAAPVAETPLHAADRVVLTLSGLTSWSGG